MLLLSWWSLMEKEHWILRAVSEYYCSGCKRRSFSSFSTKDCSSIRRCLLAPAAAQRGGVVSLLPQLRDMNRLLHSRYIKCKVQPFSFSFFCKVEQNLLRIPSPFYQFLVFSNYPRPTDTSSFVRRGTATTLFLKL